MRSLGLAGLLALFLAGSASRNLSADDPSHSPRLLLNAKLLRRLKHDRQRQTTRWVAFENRVLNVPDSPERGFELALYYAITGDENRRKEAIGWAAAHPCERRQDALIRDWVGGTTVDPCSSSSLRDAAFDKITAGGDLNTLVAEARTKFVPQLVARGFTSSADLYEAVELLYVLRANTDDDVRSAALPFFKDLPIEFLLSLKPDQVDKPSWITHVVALALVSLDPNLPASQFLQGWAMEDRQTLHDGPGLAYELLWADPYLPGIAYQNLDPWVYDESGSRLFARTSWNRDACWLSLSPAGLKDLNCPPGWPGKPADFGSLTLIPAAPKCFDLQHRDPRQSLIVWKLQPGESLSYRESKNDKKQTAESADRSGLWRIGANIEGKVCRR